MPKKNKRSDECVCVNGSIKKTRYLRREKIDEITQVFTHSHTPTHTHSIAHTHFLLIMLKFAWKSEKVVRMDTPV